VSDTSERAASGHMRKGGQDAIEVHVPLSGNGKGSNGGQVGSG